VNLDETTRNQIAGMVASSEVLLFMKGNREAPQCGFSATVVRILDGLLASYDTFDVLSDQTLRDGIKEFSSWPTIPQLYVKGEFLGGCDIIQELHGTGELADTLGIEIDPDALPDVTVSDAAAETLGRANQDASPDQVLHLGIDARFKSSLFMAPQAEGEIEITANGVRILMDRLTASRAKQAEIGVAKARGGTGFEVRLPMAPERVKQLPVAELKQRLSAGEKFEFIDVRTPEERATASIPGTTLINEGAAQRLEALPKDTSLVFHCHHGGRSQAAAEHFADLGFTDVSNVVGGIDAWSQEIDSSVPRY
jgi:monothiol glutaredoxin